MSVAEQCSIGCGEAKYYLIFLYSIPGRSLSPELINLHAAHLAELDQNGMLVLAGPISERAGGLIVLRTANKAEARAIAEDDPLVRGAYQTYELGTWLMSNRHNGYSPKIRQESDR
jgi:uncharacterized protein YciI